MSIGFTAVRLLLVFGILVATAFQLESDKADADETAVIYECKIASENEITKNVSKFVGLKNQSVRVGLCWNLRLVITRSETNFDCLVCSLTRSGYNRESRYSFYPRMRNGLIRIRQNRWSQYRVGTGNCHNT